MGDQKRHNTSFYVNIYPEKVYRSYTFYIGYIG